MVGSDRRDRDHGARAGAGGFPGRAGLRRLARTRAVAEVEWGQTEARCGAEAGRADHPAPAHSRRERGCRLGRSARRAEGLVAGVDAGAQAQDAGRRGVGQQDGLRRLGLAGQGRRASGSGCGGVSRARLRRRGANGRRAWRNGRRDGIGTTRLHHRVSSTRCVIWTQSANSHAGLWQLAAARSGRWQHPATRHGRPQMVQGYAAAPSGAVIGGLHKRIP